MPEYSPNPNTGYYDFGSQPFNMPPGLSSMMGVPQGGNNPSLDEYWRNRSVAGDRQTLMSDVYRQDPRSKAAAAMLMHQMFGEQHRQRSQFLSKIGGAGNLNELIGWGLNHPSVSSHFGGSVGSLTMGALGATSGGMTVNGRQMFGDNPFSVMSARHMVNQVNRGFYGSTGAANMAATMGLNRDQLGGIMLAGGTQGAFAGLDMGKLTQVKGGMNFETNGGSLKKIEDFTKSAAKFVSGLIDVFGQGSITQLLGKAQSITGMDLSRLENADLINQRLSGLRNTAAARGMDVGSVYRLAEGQTAAGVAMGLSNPAAGAIGVAATQQGLMDFRHRQSMSGYMPSLTPQELASRRREEMTSMTVMDPLGQMRMATEFMIESGNLSPEKVAALRSASAGANAGSRAAFGQQVKGITGQHPLDVVAMLGGPGGVQKAMSGAAFDRALKSGQGDLQSRQLGMIGNMFGQDFASLYGSLAVEDLSSAAKAYDAGEEIKLGAGSTLNAGQVKGLLSGLPGAREGNVSGTISGYKKAIQGASQVSSYISPVDQLRIAQDDVLRSQGVNVNATRGMVANQGGLAQGLLERLAGTDAKSTASMVMGMLGTKNVLGATPGQGLVLDPKRLAADPALARTTAEHLRSAYLGMDPKLRDSMGLNAAWMNGLGIAVNEGGTVNTDAFRNAMGNPEQLGKMNSMFMHMTDAQGQSMLIPRQIFERMQEHGPKLAQMVGAVQLLRKEGKGDEHLFGRMLLNLTNPKTDVSQQVALFDKMITRPGILPRESLAKLSAGAYGNMGQMLADNIEDRKRQLLATIGDQSSTGSAKSAAEKELRERNLDMMELNKAGIHSAEQLNKGASRIFGTLVLEGLDSSGRLLGKLQGGMNK